jgi:hypothetical protein
MKQAIIQGGQVIQPRDTLPVLAEADVIVAGGGTGGICAAVAAARVGVRTVLVERYGFLGGGLTSSHTDDSVPSHFGPGLGPVIGGIWEDLRNRLMAAGGSPGTLKIEGPWHRASWPAVITPVRPEALKHVAMEMLLESGVDVLLHCAAVGVIMDGPRVRGVVTESKSGRQAILGKVVVDATGDGDLLAAAGAPFRQGDEATGKKMGMTLHFSVRNAEPAAFWDFVQSHPEDVPRWFRLVELDGSDAGGYRFPLPFGAMGFEPLLQRAKERGELNYTHGAMGISFLNDPDEAHINATRVSDLDPTSVRDLTLAQIETRRQAVSLTDFLRREIPGFRNAEICHSGAELERREGRRIVGEYVLQAEELLEEREYPDTVMRGAYHLETHDPDTGARVWTWVTHPYNIPYRAFIPKQAENILPGSGRALSQSQEVSGAMRVAPSKLGVGHAAGVAAALAARSGVSPAQIDVNELRAVLKGQGAILD